MNGAIEQDNMSRRNPEPVPEGDGPAAEPFGDLVQKMSASPLALLIGPRGAATSQFARAAASACAELRDRPLDGRCGDVVVLFDQWSGDPLLALGEAIAAALSSATGSAISPARPGRRTLARTLAHWADQFGADFILVLDQYERNLAAEPLDARNARFAEQLAEAVVENAPHSRFLVVVDTSSEPLLVRLTARIGGACNSVVRLADMPVPSDEPTLADDPAQAAVPPSAIAEEPLPAGFSALADEQIDTSATEGILRRRARRKAVARWRNGAVVAALVIAGSAGIALFRHFQAPDPGARLARALDPTAPPATVAPPPGPPPAPETANVAERTPPVEPAPVPPAAPAATPKVVLAKPASTAAQATPQAMSQPSPPTVPSPERPLAATAAATPPGSMPPAPTLAETAASRPETSLTPATKLAKIVLTPPTVAAKADPPPTFKVDAPPGPPLSAKKVRAVANPENEPMLFIHIRSESQRAQARSVAGGLARLSIVVSGIGVDESGPTQADLRYFRGGERDEATYLARALGKLGVSGLRVRQVAGHEAAAVPRHYELWLGPPKR
jgi:hypothetical protein